MLPYSHRCNSWAHTLWPRRHNENATQFDNVQFAHSEWNMSLGYSCVAHRGKILFLSLPILESYKRFGLMFVSIQHPLIPRNNPIIDNISSPDVSWTKCRSLYPAGVRSVRSPCCLYLISLQPDSMTFQYGNAVSLSEPRLSSMRVLLLFYRFEQHSWFMIFS